MTHKCAIVDNEWCWGGNNPNIHFKGIFKIYVQNMPVRKRTDVKSKACGWFLVPINVSNWFSLPAQGRFPSLSMTSVLIAGKSIFTDLLTANCPGIGIIRRLDDWPNSGDCVPSSDQQGLLHTLVLEMMRTMPTKWMNKWVTSGSYPETKQSESTTECGDEGGIALLHSLKSKVFMFQMKDGDHGAARRTDWEGPTMNLHSMID